MGFIRWNTRSKAPKDEEREYETVGTDRRDEGQTQHGIQKEARNTGYQSEIGKESPTFQEEVGKI